MKTCDSCEHWDEPGCGVDESGFCLKIEFDESERLAWLVSPGSLITGRAFGCVLHEQRKEKTA
jgi:hypothetical protein